MERAICAESIIFDAEFIMFGAGFIMFNTKTRDVYNANLCPVRLGLIAGPFLQHVKDVEHPLRGVARLI